MMPETYVELCQYWESPEFKAIAEQNKKNRASPNGGPSHCLGSISIPTAYAAEVSFRNL